MPTVHMTKAEVKITQFSNAEALLKKINFDLWRIYRAIMVINDLGGNGSIEVHLVRGKIRLNNGLYLKPGFNDQELTHASQP